MKLGSPKSILFFILLFCSFSSFGLTANFTQDYISGCSPLVVHFTNTSSGATSYYWDLGNGTYSTLTNVSGSYITPGTYTVVLTAYNGSSTSTHTVTITVFPSPTVSFYASDTAICPYTSTTFTSTSSPGVSGAVTYYWNFGDGANSTAASPSHAYSTPGYYNVTLIVTNSAGCSTSLTLGAYIHVYNHSSLAFATPTPYNCDVPANVTFTNGTTGAGPFTYAWDFGDGGTATGATPTHTYGSTGTYSVRLIATDANGCSDTFTRPSYINVTNLTAAFTFTSTSCTGAYAIFYNTSSSHISSSWDFGDGGTATSDTGIHRYTSPGTYTVRLVVFNGYCYDTVYNSITVLPPPSASFTWSPVHPCPAPASVTFIGSVPSGSSVTWRFGDGTTGAGIVTSHTFANNAMDTVMMTVTDINGCVDSIVQYVPIMGIRFDIITSTDHGCNPLTVAFNTSFFGYMAGYGAMAYYDTISSFTWNFGDGSSTATSTLPNPSHTFTAVGVYHTTCTIITGNGCTLTDTVDISVGEPPTVTFTATPTHVCYNRPVYFTAVSDSADMYYWTFGDGTTHNDSARMVTHTFAIPGTFHVTVIAYSNGCPSAPYTWTDSIIVDSPKAIFNSTYFCSPYTKVFFEDQSMGDDSHVFMFGDGFTSTADTVTHIYPTQAIYVCTLATYNARSGCRDTATASVNLIPPVPHMFADDTVLCVGEAVYFSDTISGGTANAFFWYVNGVCHNFDTAQNYIDTFWTSGRFDIMLVVQDGHGCFDTAIKNDWITVGKPVDSFSVTPSSGCWPLTVTFNDHTTDVTGLTITNYRWAFGDGGVASVSTMPITHTYTAAGVYTVSSFVTDNIGCKDTSIRPGLITVWRPRATFTSSTVYPCLGNSVTFNNTSTGITGSFWMFGDGDTSSVTSPAHTYTAIGSYTVKLVVFDVHGCSDTATFVNLINVTKPNAGFYMDDSFSICPPLSVHFYNTSTGATSFNWAFGDGGTSVLMTPSNLYTSPGLYTVMLIATNSRGCKDTAYGHANVYGYAGAFNYTPDTGCAPLLVHFSASLSNVPNIVWDFADGTTTATAFSDTTSHLYTIPGAYLPKLILSDNTGCQNSSVAVDTIKVNAVIPGFTTNPSPVCVNTDIYFVDTSRSFFSTVNSWYWTLSDGSNSTVSSPFYHYYNVGTFPVTLTVVDAWGCTASVSQNIIVYPPPNVTTSPDTVVCVTDSATLRGYGASTYVWTPSATLGCPTCQSTGASPAVVTTYTVVGTDIHGCKSIDSVTVGLRTTTESRAWGDSEVCQFVPVPLFDTGGTKYTWIPSTGLSNPTIGNPIATPNSTTHYMVIAQLGSCIPDTNYVTVIVHPLPTVDAGPDQRKLAGQVAYLAATGTGIVSYMWSPAISLSCETCSDPVASMISTTTYKVTVASDFGCKASDDVTVIVFCDESQLYIPNTFSPNGDGQNDVFFPRGSGISNIKTFRIYNRWGEMIFEKLNIDINDEGNAWDGSYKGASPKPDVYVYLIDATCGTGEPLFIKGDITLIK